MRRIERAFIATVALAAGVALSGGAAVAQSFYVKGFGGFSFPQDDDFDLGARDGSGDSFATGLNYDTGYVLGAAGGYMITPNVAVELEYAFRSADADFKGDGPGVTTQSNAWMANALYYFTPVGVAGAWQPYAGGGLGVADLNVDDFPNELGGDLDSDYNFAYQLIGGVAYNITPNWQLNGEARFFGINDQDVENDAVSFKSTYHTFDLLFGATYAF